MQKFCVCGTNKQVGNISLAALAAALGPSVWAMPLTGTSSGM